MNCGISVDGDMFTIFLTLIWPTLIGCCKLLHLQTSVRNLFSFGEMGIDQYVLEVMYLGSMPSMDVRFWTARKELGANFISFIILTFIFLGCMRHSQLYILLIFWEIHVRSLIAIFLGGSMYRLRAYLGSSPFGSFSGLFTCQKK